MEARWHVESQRASLTMNRPQLSGWMCGFYSIQIPAQYPGRMPDTSRRLLDWMLVQIALFMLGVFVVQAPSEVIRNDLSAQLAA